MNIKERIILYWYLTQHFISRICFIGGFIVGIASFLLAFIEQERDLITFLFAPCVIISFFGFHLEIFSRKNLIFQMKYGKLKDINQDVKDNVRFRHFKMVDR